MSRVPFISIVTRTFNKRPSLYARHLDSLAAQTMRSFEHVVITNSHSGVLDANRSLHQNRHRVRGTYIMILDDDDRLASASVLQQIYDCALLFDLPPCIMVRMQRPDRIVPDEDKWGMPPVAGHIGSPCFIVRRELWVKYIRKFGRPLRGDYYFISHIWPKIESRTVWLDIIAADIMVVSHGKPEDVHA